jgi:hypothetical protein
MRAHTVAGQQMLDRTLLVLAPVDGLTHAKLGSSAYRGCASAWTGPASGTGAGPSRFDVV